MATSEPALLPRAATGDTADAIRDTNLGIAGIYPSMADAKRRGGIVKPWGALCYFPDKRGAAKFQIVSLSETDEFPDEIKSPYRLPDRLRKQKLSLTIARVKRGVPSEAYFHSRLPVGLSMEQAKSNLEKVNSIFVGKRRKSVPKLVAYDQTVAQFEDEVQWPYFNYQAAKYKNGDIFSESDYLEGYKLALIAAGLEHVPLQVKESQPEDHNNNIQKGDSRPVAPVTVKYGTSSETVGNRKPRKNVLQNSTQLGVTPMVRLQRILFAI